MEDLGCFYTGPPFFSFPLRPVSLEPFDLKNMTTKFLLFTPSNKFQAYELERTEDSLHQSPFDDSLSTKFLIHGYHGNLTHEHDMKGMKTAFLNQSNYNIFVVDWVNTSKSPYPQAVANARVVGAQVAQMIRFLQTHSNVKPESIHLIGHSLGGHIAGWTGERVRNISRITGLDPAGPYFIQTEKEVRLDTTDATFVDIIHTNAATPPFGMGTPEEIGHIDFFLNGGTNQPCCEGLDTKGISSPLQIQIPFADGMITTIDTTSTMKCDHAMAIKYFIASIPNECLLHGGICNKFTLFAEEKCQYNQRTVMGYFVNQSLRNFEGKKFFLNTASQAPYCLSENKNIP